MKTARVELRKLRVYVWSECNTTGYKPELLMTKRNSDVYAEGLPLSNERTVVRGRNRP